MTITARVRPMFAHNLDKAVSEIEGLGISVSIKREFLDRIVTITIPDSDEDPIEAAFQLGWLWGQLLHN